MLRYESSFVYEVRRQGDVKEGNDWLDSADYGMQSPINCINQLYQVVEKRFLRFEFSTIFSRG
jgi:hypothetical protein